MSITHYREWVSRFKSSNFDVCNQPHPGAPKKFEDEELEALLQKICVKLCRNYQKYKMLIQRQLGNTYTTLSEKERNWIPHQLSERQQERRFVASELLIERDK